MSRPKLSIVPPTELVSYTSTDFTEPPLSPNTPLSPSSKRRHESTWDRIQRLKRDAEAFHERRRASSATEPPMSLIDLAEEVIRGRIQEEEEDKRLEEEEKDNEERKKVEEIKQDENKEKEPQKGFKPPSLVVTPEKVPPKSPSTPKSPKTPSTPKSFKVSTSEPAEITSDLKMLWDELRKQKTQLLWVLLGFPDSKSRKVCIRGIGTAPEGIGELKSKLQAKAVQFGALRVIAVDDHARRPKFIGFALVGAELTPSQKLQAMHAKEIQRDLFTGIHAMLEFSTSQDFEVQISKSVISLEKSAKLLDYGGGLKITAASLTSS